MPHTREEIAARLLANRSLEDRGYKTPCWIWTKSCQPKDYGQTSFGSPLRNRRVHRVSAWLWLGFDLEATDLVCHHCDVPRCFNPAHLFVGTPKANTADMIEKGRANLSHPLRGEKHPRHILTEAAVREIREYVAEHGAPRGTYAMLARKYGVTNTLIGYVVKRRAWAHIP